MAGEEPLKNSSSKEVEQDRGLLVLEQLKIMNKLLGSINQNITSLITPIKHDIEMCKVTLSKMKKMGAQEVTIKDDRKPEPYRPPTPGGNS